MALVYDKTIEAAMRGLAVQNIDEINVGDTLFSNTYPEEMVVLEILTHAEHLKDIELTSYYPSQTLWVKCRHRDGVTSFPTSDRGIGVKPYNPWMVFKTKGRAMLCREELKISFKSDYTGY